MSSSNYPQSGPGSGAYPQLQSNKTNTLAIVSFISSFFISVLGVILGHIALSQIKRTGEGGRGLAIAGLIIGYLGMLAGIILFFTVLGAAGSQV